MTIDVTTTNPLTEKRLIFLISRRSKRSKDSVLLVTSDQYEIMRDFKGTCVRVTGPGPDDGPIVYVGAGGIHPVEVKT